MYIYFFNYGRFIIFNEFKYRTQSYNDFVIGQEDLLERYSEIPSLEASKEMIFRNCDVLLHEHSQSYMLLSCLEDEVIIHFFP
jgi:cell division cycle protein 37